LQSEKKYYKNRFEIITYNESKLSECEYLKNNDSKGASEIFSINYAFDNSTITKKSTFIIKITGRFFIPELENYLNNYDLNNYDCLTQNNRDRCEMVGSNIKNFNHIFNIKLIDLNGNYNGHIENVWKYRTSTFKNNLVCKIFEIEKTQRGGLNSFFTNI